MKEIARKLNISPRTVESHIEEIKLKMDCQTKSQLIKKGIHANLLDIIPRKNI